MNKVIIFDVWSSFGYFRKFYTTTTALTYPFIPRSAAEGLIAAITGLDSADYPDRLAPSKIAVGILNEMRKLQFSLSYTHIDFWSQRVDAYLRRGGTPPLHRTAPRRIELLCEPKYRIYFSCEDRAFMQELATNLADKKTVFTPYLGTSAMLADFKLISSDATYQDIGVSGSKPLMVSSVVPFVDKMPKVFVYEGGRYAIEQSIPIHVTADRDLRGVYSAIYNPKGGGILVSDTVVQKVKVNGEDLYISFVPTLSKTY